MPTVYGSITTRWDASSQASGSGPTPTPTYLRRFAKHYGVSVTVMDGLGNYLPFGSIMDFAEQVDALFVTGSGEEREKTSCQPSYMKLTSQFGAPDAARACVI